MKVIRRRIGGGAKLLALILLMIAFSMTAPLIMAVCLGEAAMVRAFIITMAAVSVLALPALLAAGKQPIRFSASDGFMLVFFSWVGACLLGAAPYLISRCIPGLADAVFESVSGFTTTGASVIEDLDAMPRSLILWRAETHWLGGMGMVVLTVALLPLLGVGGFRLIKAETTGPEKDRITPKITETAKLLWIMYVVLTAVQAALLYGAGMSVFDAVIHAFSTMATGGFSSHNESLAYFDSPAIQWITIVFMLVAGYNFSLLFRLLRRQFREVWNNSEGRAYLAIVAVSVLIITAALSVPAAGFEPEAVSSLGGTLRRAFFYVASVITTTGFSILDHNLWPPAAGAVLFMLMLVGGCSGSTAGGIKVIRHVVLWKQCGNELRRVIYPRGVFSIRLNKKVGRKDVVYGVAGFIFLYCALAALGMLVVASTGLDLFSSLNTSFLAIGNIGLGFGKIDSAEAFHLFPAYVKWFLSFIMLAGRLELWTVFVFFSKDFWHSRW
ncbi:MAG: TrkH family potassium uptake protein [Treponema sp.]|jgi:trk system potassium uptake protein TrkH|nr:TrkH family potassium uptake protein [Treponema sp.]